MWLEQQYYEGNTGEVIAKLTNVSATTISKWTKKCGINARKLIDRAKFKKQHGMFPEDLEKFLREQKITVSQYAKSKKMSSDAVQHQFARFHIKAPCAELVVKVEVTCLQCGLIFHVYPHKLLSGRGRYCSKKCANAAKRVPPNNKFLCIAPCYIIPHGLGDYSHLLLGVRQRQFVNRNSVNHLFFKNGVINEAQAYVLGILVTDGNVDHFSRKQGYRVRLEMVDHDIVNTVADLLEYQNTRSISASRGSLSIGISSPYLFHDLTSLGCVPRKTDKLQYPTIPDNLDRHFIRGAIDGDGSWRLINQRLRLKFCGHDQFVWGFVDRIKSHLQVEPHGVEYPPKRKMQSFCSIEYNTTDSVLIRNWVYSDAKHFGARRHYAAYSQVKSYLELFGVKALSDVLEIGLDALMKILKKYNLPCQRRGPYRFFENADLVLICVTLRDFRPDLKERLDALLTWLETGEDVNTINFNNKWLPTEALMHKTIGNEEEVGCFRYI
jgi:hypothetical protein